MLSMHNDCGRASSEHDRAWRAKAKAAGPPTVVELSGEGGRQMAVLSTGFERRFTLPRVSNTRWSRAGAVTPPDLDGLLGPHLDGLPDRHGRSPPRAVCQLGQHPTRLARRSRAGATARSLWLSRSHPALSRLSTSHLRAGTRVDVGRLLLAGPAIGDSPMPHWLALPSVVWRLAHGPEVRSCRPRQRGH